MLIINKYIMELANETIKMVLSVPQSVKEKTVLSGSNNGTAVHVE
jgi:hypothetical protein